MTLPVTYMYNFLSSKGAVKNKITQAVTLLEKKEIAICAVIYLYQSWFLTSIGYKQPQYDQENYMECTYNCIG